MAREQNGESRIVVSQASVEAAASRFRVGIESHVENAPHQFLRNFPKGTCKATSMLLARYLHEAGFGAPELVANAELIEDGEARRTHAWLRLAPLLIDITADQFGQAPVIVTKGSQFHEQFRRQQSYPFDNYMRFNPKYEKEHMKIYRDVLRRIPD